jgi:hypothetical protein
LFSHTADRIIVVLDTAGPVGFRYGISDLVDRKSFAFTIALGNKNV